MRPGISFECFCQERGDLWVGGLCGQICGLEIYSDNQSEEFIFIHIIVGHLQFPDIAQAAG